MTQYQRYFQTQGHHYPEDPHPHQEDHLQVDPVLLLKYLKARRWAEADALLHTQIGVTILATSRDEFNNTPLHVAIGYQAPEELILSILATYPNACTIPATDDLWLPLHVAAMWGCSTRILQALIVTYPEGLDQKEEKGRTPRFFSTRFAHNQALLERSTQDWKRETLRIAIAQTPRKHSIQYELKDAVTSSWSPSAMEVCEPSEAVNNCKRRKV
jgi:hypothetical protein